MKRSWHRRVRPRAVAASLVLLLALFSPSASASADAYSDADYAVALVNDVRWWEGAAPLAVDGQLQGVAEWWAGQLRDADVLAHNPGLPNQMGGWWAWGENVGWGYSIDQIHNALVNSWHHYRNMVAPWFTSIGVAVTYTDYGALYVVMVFGG